MMSKTNLCIALRHRAARYCASSTDPATSRRAGGMIRTENSFCSKDCLRRSAVLLPASRHVLAKQPRHQDRDDTWKGETKMIGVLLRFRYDADFDEQRIRKVAETAHGRFVGLPGLRSKAFAVDSEQKEALNFYVWESEAAARGFFTPELLERVTGLYGTRPTIQFAAIAALVENIPTA
jgi:hypothetical protein